MASCIAGNGMESDEQMDAIVDAIVRARANTGVTIYLETHRSSITQDSWRCLQLAERNPEIYFNCDFSHWYTGLDIQALDFDRWLEQMTPVLSRVGILHGRIGNRCCMQVPVEEKPNSLELSQRVWTRVMQLFAQSSGGPEELWFLPEILSSTYEYVRTFNGEEETDRWRDAMLLTKAACACAAEASLELSPNWQPTLAS